MCQRVVRAERRDESASCLNPDRITDEEELRVTESVPIELKEQPSSSRKSWTMREQRND